MVEEWVRPARDWTITEIIKGEYVLTLKDKYIEMTGVAVLTTLGILKSHILKKVVLKHTDNVKADSADNLKVTVQRGMGLLEALWIDLYEDTVGTTASDIALIFEKYDNYEFPTQYYRLSLNTTNTDRVYPEIYIQLARPKFAPFGAF